MPVVDFWQHRRKLPLVLATLLASIAPAGPGPTSAEGQVDCNYYASPIGTGNGLTQSSPFRIQDFWALAAPGKTLCLLDGRYQGSANMITPPSGKSGASGAPIRVRALNDGGVFIDGQFVRPPLVVDGNNFMAFEGFDVGNSNASVFTVYNTVNSTFKRICASNVVNKNPGINSHVLLVWGSSNNTFEDICVFGVGRNALQEYSGAARNTYRRFWIRWEGWFCMSNQLGAGGPPIQLGYHSAQTSSFENFITIYAPSIQTPAAQQICDPGNGLGVMITRDGTPEASSGDTMKGWISYGQDTPPSVSVDTNGGWWHSGSVQEDCAGPATCYVRRALTDIFVDARMPPALEKPFVLHGGSADRLTGVGTSSMLASEFRNFTPTNFNQCTSLGAANCPNIYTGVASGGQQGSRACFRYNNGSLTQTPLWPWPMDDRIKAALAQARAAGTGGFPLAGVSGPGYAANTVTSEIVSRYGTIPGPCRTPSQTPSVPGSVQLR